MTVSAAEKQMLMDAGAWQRFCNRRDELKSEGLKPKQAQDQALAEVMGDDVPVSLDPHTEKPQPKNPDIMEGVEALVDALPETSDPTKMIKWVGSNIRGGMNLETCPGKDAFNLMADCRQFPSFRLDYWKTMYTKVIPSRASLDDGAGIIVLDGEQTLEVLDKIKGIREAAESRDQEEIEEAECEQS